MNGSNPITAGVKICLALTLVLVTLGQLAGQPTGVSYVETESMTPTLHPGDGFVVVPATVADEPEVGDVVVYHAKTLHGGGLTTHRVVGVTGQGYVTRGDGNAYTDQDGGEPFVTEGQIRAVAVRAGGSIVVIPELGTAVMAIKAQFGAVQHGIAAATGSRAFLGTRGIGYLLLAVGILLAGTTMLLSGAGGKERSRLRSRSRRNGLNLLHVRIAFVLLLAVPATAMMVLPSGVHEFDVVGAQNPTSSPYVVEAGESSRIAYHVPNGGRIPILVLLEPASPGVAVDSERFWVAGDHTKNVTLTLSVPEEIGLYKRAVVERRYLPLLPPSLTVALYAVHPLIPVVAINVVLAASVTGVIWATVGAAPVRTRRKPRRSVRRAAGSLKRWLK